MRSLQRFVSYVSGMSLAEPQWTQTIGRRMVRIGGGTFFAFVRRALRRAVRRFRGALPGQAQWMWPPLPDVRLVLASDAILVRANMYPSLRCLLPAAPRLPRRPRRTIHLETKCSLSWFDDGLTRFDTRAELPINHSACEPSRSMAVLFGR